MKGGTKVKGRWPNKIAEIISEPAITRQKVVKMAAATGATEAACYDWISGRSFPRNPIMLGAVMRFLSDEAGVQLNPQDVWLDFDPVGQQ